MSFSPDALPQHIPYGLRHHLGHAAVQNFNFASAHPLRIASVVNFRLVLQVRLCLSTSLTDCVCDEVLPGDTVSIFASAHPLRIASANMHKNIRFFGRNVL